MLLIIDEYFGGKFTDTTEVEVNSFTEASIALVRDLTDTSSVEYTAEVLQKWFAGPAMVGDDQPFDVRQYEKKVGVWTDFRFRP